MTNRPNIIVIMPDQQRADTLGCYGNKFTETPNLDRLAGRGVVFDRAFTPYPICTPARCTMWTGMYPHGHGITWNFYGVDNLFEEQATQKTTVFDLLKDAGYLNAYFGKWHLGEKPNPAFDVWDAFNSRGGHWVDGRQSFQDGVWKPAAQTDACIAFLESEQAQSDQPFIMVQGYYPPHQPYTAPLEFYEPYRGKGVPCAGYYASVTGLDFHTGRILETLERTGLKDNTVFIYLSDHGDTFNYREGSKNKFVCHDDAIRIPFLLSWPNGAPSGTRVKAPIGLQDLAPTILDLADAETPDWMHGRSILPLLSGDDAGW
ncbi:MAG: sulfatase-like hydrolase/transferase, partial [Pseudomonadota bacterium]